MGANARSPRARALCGALREARMASGIGVRELGRMLSISFTNISLYENGHRIPNVETVAMILTAIRTSPDERERILDLARNVHEPNWLTVGITGIPQQLAGVVECERAASAIIQWTPITVPGLLQTPEYSRAIIQASGKASNEIELLVMVRTGRSEVLTRSDPVSFEALISEAALYEPIGRPRIMVNQLRHLVDMGNRPNVRVLIVPVRIGWHPGWAGPFVLYDFPDTSPVVHFEHYSSGAFIPTEHDVLEYRNAIEKLRGVALDEAASLTLIAKVADDTEKTSD